MHPNLFHLSGVEAPAYFVFLLSGFLFATAAGTAWAKRVGEDADVIVDLGLAMLLAGGAGARLLHVFADGYFWDYVHLCTDPSKVVWPFEKTECISSAIGGTWDAAANVCHPSGPDCFAWAKFWAGGLTYYGGLIAAVGVAWWLLKRDGFPFWKATDMAGFAIPIGLAFGRLGCLMAGCCFGSTCTLPWAVKFPWRSPASEEQFKDHLLASPKMWSLPVHPTQTYESFASLAIAAFLVLYVHGRKRYDGQVFAVFLALYAVARALLEIVRRDDRGGVFGLSTSQLIGIGMVAAAAVIHVVRSKAGAARAALAT